MGSNLELLRHAEAQILLGHLHPGMKVLELGGGNGYQAKVLHDHGCQVTSLDIPGRERPEVQYFPVEEYDGLHIPCPDASFDAVFSQRALKNLSCCESPHHEADHRHVNHRLAGRCEKLVVLAQSTVAPQPPEGALDDPPARQELEALQVVGTLDDLQPQLGAATERGHPREQRSSVRRVGPDEAHPGEEGVGEPLKHELGAVAILDVRRVDDDSDQQPEGVDQDVTLAPVDLFARIVPVRPPLSVVLTDWLSRMPALGSRARPSASRTSPRRCS